MSINKVEPQGTEVVPNRPQSSTCLCVINSNLVTETLLTLKKHSCGFLKGEAALTCSGKTSSCN